MAFSRKELPEKYYLDHFREFLSYVTGPCKPLLDEQDQAFIQQFEDLAEDAQCLLVRTANRKSPYIPRHTLYYDEIADTDHQLTTLFECAMLRQLNEQDLPSVFADLTKAQLSDFLTAANVEVKTSYPKSRLVELADAELCYDDIRDSASFCDVVVRNYDDELDYFLFLFFGDASSRLNKFSMRDLGVMQTRKGEQALTARFESLEQAKSTFFYRRTLRHLSTMTVSQCLALASEVDSFPAPEGDNAQSARDKLLLQLGVKVNASEPETAIKLWSLSGHPEARAKWIREQYKAGHKEAVLDELNAIIDSSESEQMLVFAEDFLARKYKKKRTSQLTDMLRENSVKLPVDEIYRDVIESGVVSHYLNQGTDAWHSENHIWRILFGLYFWEELFEADEQALVTEFDLSPRALRQNDFYQRFEQQIEARLSAHGNAQDVVRHITAMATTHYGKSNGIFWWSNDAIELVGTMVNHAPLQAIKTHLRAMCNDYKSLRDGYPDLLVIEDGKLRFEEIKGPGDQLRKNQLITINQLRKSGFDIRITQVEWFIDPMQPYVVVDIETTGGTGNFDRITEIGMVKLVNGEEVDAWQSLINPQRRIPSFITRLTGIDDDMVADAPLFSDVADTINKFVQGCIFVAHNVNFDYGFFRREFERLDYPFKMPKLCTVKEMRKAVPGLPSYSLANLTAHFDIDMDQHHRAMSDAKAAAELLKIIHKHRQET